jgi:hypothetical protein
MITYLPIFSGVARARLAGEFWGTVDPGISGMPSEDKERQARPL